MYLLQTGGTDMNEILAIGHGGPPKNPGEVPLFRYYEAHPDELRHRASLHIQNRINALEGFGITDNALDRVAAIRVTDPRLPEPPMMFATESSFMGLSQCEYFLYLESGKADPNYKYAGIPPRSRALINALPPMMRQILDEMCTYTRSCGRCSASACRVP
jgi:hypothetical protein